MSLENKQPEVNKMARRQRHKRVFANRSLVFVLIKSFFRKFYFRPFRKRDKQEKSAWSPQRKLFVQSLVMSICFLVFPGFSEGSTFTSGSLDYSVNYIDAYFLPGDVLVSDEEGYLVKINPQTSKSNRSDLRDFAIHVVESGESLSVIAENYGVNANTIMWENGITNVNRIRAGQQLLIPPINGVSYQILPGDTVEKVAEKYEISKELIVAHNELEADVLPKGQEIFLPGAEPIVEKKPVVVAQRGNYTQVTTINTPTAAGSFGTVDADPNTATPSFGKIFIFPTEGKVTQGYRAGHYALDIADRSKPPIWAAGAGKVIKAEAGGWSGGYGTHVIVDHGDGLSTLYAHMETISVQVGDEVGQGDVLGKMGNTGRVYGVTGIHLHWEVILNGVKQNPYNYF
jgi:murein DD-endopeptidase MepM/ murein hydrolase activator NlpD